MELILIRHGPTEWNALERFQGRSDIPLSPAGLVDAHAIAAALRNERIDRIYSSDLVRALDTARIIGDASGTEIIADPRLREFDFGRWEGLTWHEIVAAYPELTGNRPTGARLYEPAGGETFAQVRRRVRSFLDDLQRQDPGARIVVVTHAGPLHAFLAELELTRTGGDFDRFAPAGITRIAIDGRRARLIALNDMEHLSSAC
ncbi:MAG TPA: histidine phosphatase family protein [Candidatus Cybelea sp.]|nr:histidine phosphatase family protein [Candidatus Cybelea sp.]